MLPLTGAQSAPSISVQSTEKSHVWTTWLPDGLSFRGTNVKYVLLRAHKIAIAEQRLRVKDYPPLSVRLIKSVEQDTITKLWDEISPIFEEKMKKCALGYNPRNYIQHLYQLKARVQINKIYLYISKLIKTLKQAWRLAKLTLGYVKPQGLILPDNKYSALYLKFIISDKITRPRQVYKGSSFKKKAQVMVQKTSESTDQSYDSDDLGISDEIEDVTFSDSAGESTDSY